MRRTVAAVGYSGAYPHRTVPAQSRRIDHRGTVGDVAIGQAMAERIKRLVGNLAVARLVFLVRRPLRAARRAVIVVIGLLTRRLREGDRQAALRGKIAEDDKFAAKDKLQEMVDEYNKKIEEVREKKEMEITTI